MATVNVTSLSSLIKNYLPKYRKAQVLLLPCGENKESGPVDRQLQIVSDFQALNARIDTLS